MFTRPAKDGKTETPTQASGHVDRLIDDWASERCVGLFTLCEYVLKRKSSRPNAISRVLLQLHTESTIVEELVDNIGAQHNETWYPFREAVAAVKLFSATCYHLLHIQEALPRYRLIKVQGNFYEATEKTSATLLNGVVAAAKSALFQAKKRGLLPDAKEAKIQRAELSPAEHRLPADRNTRHIEKTGEKVVFLSTAFLNLSSDRNVASVLTERESSNYSGCIPDAVNEESIRSVEARFHNLQSYYDTYIFESDVEKGNRNLPILRGHISVIYHLLEVATNLAHYYERHMSKLRRDMIGEARFPLNSRLLLNVLFEYFLTYAKRYMDVSVNLCQGLIQSYSEKREIEAPIPNYRGFHVRPSTLVAKVVAHYGSTVSMVLDGQEYNAGIVLDLFRANEKINALKRRYITEVLEDRMDPERMIEHQNENLQRKLQILFLELANDHSIILYDTSLAFDELEPSEDEPITAFVSRYIKHYMSISKIDVETDLTAVFKGDNRALIDIKLLAENGYGEDRFGNNIVLPQELVYLRM